MNEEQQNQTENQVDPSMRQYATSTPGFSEQQPVPKKGKGLKIFLIIFTLLIIGGGGVFAYTKGFNPFSKASYDESNLMSGLVTNARDIKSASYALSVLVKVEERDADAEAIVIPEIPQDVLDAYKRDYERSRELSSILSYVNSFSYNGTYPKTLNGFLSQYRSPDQIEDPLTKARYSYVTNAAANDFNLTITFETDDAIDAIEHGGYYYYDEKENVVRIVDKTVTFNKESSSYYYISSFPPVTFLESLDNMAAFLPNEMEASATLSGAHDWGIEGTPAQWMINVDAEGDFGDLSYKVNADARKKDDNYYFRINNLPSLFLSYLPLEKGQWLVVTTQDLEENGFGFDSYIDLAENDAEYDKFRKEVRDVIMRIAQAADEENAFVFKNSPSKESIDGRSLYKYELDFERENLKSLYKRTATILKEQDEYAFEDVGDALTRYMDTDLDQMLDWAEDNVNITFWTDTSGKPAILQTSLRIVPSEEHGKFDDKQIIIQFTVTLSDINKEVNVETPADAISFDEMFDAIYGEGAFDEERNQSLNSIIRANISNIRVSAELVFDKQNGYGTKAFALGPCKKTEGTLFGEDEVFESIMAATDDQPTLATCVSGYVGSSIGAWALSVPLKGDEIGYYCVDSTGIVTEITSALSGYSCK